MKSRRLDQPSGQGGNQTTCEQNAQQEHQEGHALRNLVRARQIFKPGRRPLVAHRSHNEPGDQGGQRNKLADEPLQERCEGRQQHDPHQGPVEPVPCQGALQTQTGGPDSIERVSRQETVCFPVLLAGLLDHLARE